MKLANISDADLQNAQTYYGISGMPKENDGEWIKIHDINTQGNLAIFKSGNQSQILALSPLDLTGKVKDIHFNDTSIQIIVTAPNENFILSNTLKNLFIYRAYKRDQQTNDILNELEDAIYSVENENTRIILNEDNKEHLEKRIAWYEAKLADIKKWELNQKQTKEEMLKRTWFGIIKKQNSQATDTYYITNSNMIRRLNHGEDRWVSLNYDFTQQPEYYRDFFREHPMFSFKQEIIDARGVKIKDWEPSGSVTTTTKKHNQDGLSVAPTGDIALVKTNKHYEIVAHIPRLHIIICTCVTKQGSLFNIRCVGSEPFKINIRQYIETEMKEKIDHFLTGSREHANQAKIETMFSYDYNDTTGELSSQISPAFYYDSTLALNKTKEARDNGNYEELEYVKIGAFCANSFTAPDDKNVNVTTMSGAQALGHNHSGLNGSTFATYGKNFGKLITDNNKAVWGNADYHTCELIESLLTIQIAENSFNHPLYRVPRANKIIGLSLELGRHDTLGYYTAFSSGSETVQMAKACGIEWQNSHRVYCYQNTGGNYAIVGSEFVLSALTFISGANWAHSSRLQLLNNPVY